MKAATLFLCVCAIVGAAVLLINIFNEIERLGVNVRRPIPIESRRPAEEFPRRASPDSRLEGPSPDDVLTQVRAESGPRQDGAGTAFAVHKFGWFMTARHVVEDCDRIGVVNNNRRIAAVSEIILSNRVDLALIQSPYDALPLPVERPTLRYGQSGFGYGFRKARWDQIHGLLLGRARGFWPGEVTRVEPTLVWSIRDMPESGLGGMSGSPMLDESGTVVGVHSSYSRRRGRLSTVAPSSLNAMLGENELSQDELRELGFDLEGLDEHRYIQIGERLRLRGRVVLVICDVEDHDGIKGWE